MNKILISYHELVEIEYEFIILEKQLEIIEEQVVVLTEQKQHAHKAKFLAMNYIPDDPDRQIEQQEHFEYVDYILPRIFRNTYIIALWAGFESAVVELSKLFNKKGDLNLTINDLKGGFLDRSVKFYDKVLGIKLFKTKNQRKNIQQIYSLRNAIAHASGRLELLNSGEYKKIIDADIGIDNFYGNIVLSKNFNEMAFKEVKKVIDYLLSKYKETYY